MDETQGYLEQLGLPELDGPVTVEMVIEKAPEQDEEETSSDTETQAEDETSSDEEEGVDPAAEDTPEDEEEEETPERKKITVQLNPTDAPVTSANFVDLVEQNFYDAIAFHRFVDGFVAQAGDPASRDTDVLEELQNLGSGTYIDPATDAPREIPLEIKLAETGEFVYNQIVDEPVELSHEQGVIAMARKSDPLDSASSQFYFTLDDVSDQLDGGYAVFGEVTDGLDDVLGIREGDRILLARIVDGSISSRQSNIVDNYELLNELTNKDNQQKVSYVASLGANVENIASSNDSSDDGAGIETSILDSSLTNSQLTQTIDDEINGGGDDSSETSAAPQSDENQEDSDTASAINNSDRQIIKASKDDDYLKMSDSDAVAMMGLEGDDEIYGSSGNDLISGNDGNDGLYGLEGDDLLRGGKGDDTLTGGKGKDILIGDYGYDILTGGQDADSFILRADTAEGIEDISLADMITDFSLVDGDRIVVIGEFIPSADFSYDLVDGNTVIKLLETNYILGVVNQTPIADVRDSIFVASADDYLLRLG
jgi:peptidyl-prolyl cis-trans isomerase B (cyclophilin B)